MIFFHHFWTEMNVQGALTAAKKLANDYKLVEMVAQVRLCYFPNLLKMQSQRNHFYSCPTHTDRRTGHDIKVPK